MKDDHAAGKLELTEEEAKEAEACAGLLSSNLDLTNHDIMSAFNCDTQWPICMFDFTYKNKTNHQQAMRSRYKLTSFVVEDHFYPECDQNKAQIG